MALLDKSPEFWSRHATLNELQAAVRAIKTWSDDQAEVLDFAYLERCLRLLGRPEASAQAEALALAEHLERVAHDRARGQLEGLRRPYFVRWRMFVELLQRFAHRLEAPPTSVLERKHVRPLLLAVYEAGGRCAQADLAHIIGNEGQRSVTLKLMEEWELIERPSVGNTRQVVLTALGRLAIGPEIDALAEERAARSSGPFGKRFCEIMTSVA